MTVAEQADESAVREDPVRTRALIIGTGFPELGMAGDPPVAALGV